MPLNAFQPQGNTKLIIATTTATAAQQLSDGNITGARITVDANVFMAYGATTDVAATIPTTSTPGGMPLMLSSTGLRVSETFTLGPNTYVSFITPSTAANVWVTPGYGS